MTTINKLWQLIKVLKLHTQTGIAHCKYATPVFK